MLQKTLEFLFSLDHVSITPNTRFAMVMDAWAVPCILGAVLLALVFALIALVWTARGEARAQRKVPAIAVLSAAAALLAVLLPFAILGARHGTIGEARFSVGREGLDIPAGLPLFTLTLATAVLAWLGYWSYRKQSASRGRRVALGILRAALLVVLLFLFCRPQLVMEREQRTRGVVAVWIDTSGSMTLRDPYNQDPAMRDFSTKTLKGNPLPPGQSRLTRYQLALDSLSAAQWLKGLTETQDVAFFKGSTHAEEVGTARFADQVQPLLDQLQQEKITGEATDVPVVVQEILQKVQGTTVSAIVLLTDGQTTEAGSLPDVAVAAANRTSTKIFSLPLGQEKEPFDIALEGGLEAPETAFVRDPVSVKVRLSGAGIEHPTPVKVTLYRKVDGVLSELASKEFTLDPTKKSMDAELIFKPERKPGAPMEKDRYDLVAKAEATGMGAAEELNPNNNQATGMTNVLDAQINVLYVDRAPRWEFRYVKNELIREKTVNVSTLLMDADSDFPQEGDPQVVDKNGKEIFPGAITRFPETREELDKYQVILIGDVDPSFFSPRQQDLILNFVRNSGGGIGWIAGPVWDPEGYKGTKMEPLLPIVADDPDPRARVMPPAPNEPFTLVLTAAGRESNLFRFFDDPDQNARQLKELPQMYWYKPVLGLQPASKVLAVHSTRTQGGMPVPLIVEGRYGKGRTLFSAVADTWRWRRYNGEPLFQSYWLQMCRLLYQGKALNQSGIVLSAETNRVEVGKPIKVMMRVADPTLLPEMPQQVPVMVQDAKGQVIETIVLQRGATEDQQDQWSGMTTATQLGTLSLAVAPGVVPGPDLTPYQVTVETPQREFEKTSADLESLGTLASETTGAVVPLYKAEALAKEIPDRSMFTILTDYEELWYKPIALILVLALVTAEWLVRKRAGLI